MRSTRLARSAAGSRNGSPAESSAPPLNAPATMSVLSTQPETTITAADMAARRPQVPFTPPPYAAPATRAKFPSVVGKRDLAAADLDHVARDVDVPIGVDAQAELAAPAGVLALVDR